MTKATVDLRFICDPDGAKIELINTENTDDSHYQCDYAFSFKGKLACG